MSLRTWWVVNVQKFWNLQKSSERNETASHVVGVEHYIILAGYPLGGNHNMKYRIIILIIIIKRLGEILLSYIAHTLRTHTSLPLCGYGPGL